jgi:ABC-type polar amino acid transport system ATPase subunit
VIKLQNIEKHFGDHRVLSSVNLELESGHVTALIGPSGSGKSTRCNSAISASNSAAMASRRAMRCSPSGVALAWCFRTSSCSRI